MKRISVQKHTIVSTFGMVSIRVGGCVSFTHLRLSIRNAYMTTRFLHSGSLCYHKGSPSCCLDAIPYVPSTGRKSLSC